MIKTVWKFKVQPGIFNLTMPKCSKFLSVQMQYGEPQAWFLVNKTEDPGIRTYQVVATGEDFDDYGRIYLGTFQTQPGSLVFHLFEKT